MTMFSFATKGHRAVPRTYIMDEKGSKAEPQEKAFDYKESFLCSKPISHELPGIGSVRASKADLSLMPIEALNNLFKCSLPEFFSSNKSYLFLLRKKIQYHIVLKVQIVE